MSKVVCPYCRSANIIKYGKRCNTQIYHCKDCRKYFSENTSSRQTLIKISLSLYEKGLSYRKIQRHLQEVYGCKISHVTIRNWVLKYAESTEVC